MPQLRERLALPISDLDLSVRASNCLEAEDVKTIGDLQTMPFARLAGVVGRHAARHFQALARGQEL